MRARMEGEGWRMEVIYGYLNNKYLRMLWIHIDYHINLRKNTWIDLH
jgi:hypothetical protein